MGSVEKCNEKNAIYVDKTELAKKVIQSGERSSLFLRPRRFGKTFFLNTLQSILLGKKEVFENTFIGDPQNGYGWQAHTVLRLTFDRPEYSPVRALSLILIEIAKANGVDKELDNIEHTNPLYFEMLLRKLSPIDPLGKPKPGNKQPLALLIDEYDLPFKNTDEEIRKYFYSILPV